MALQNRPYLEVEEPPAPQIEFGEKPYRRTNFRTKRQELVLKKMNELEKRYDKETLCIKDSTHFHIYVRSEDALVDTDN